MCVIGIVSRKYISKEGHDINITYSDIEKAIIENNGIPISITLNSNYKNIINLCDGIIFQGGDEFEEHDEEALKYIYEIDKPVLGICLGMQLMGVLFNGTMIDINNHKKDLLYAHSVNIIRNSILNKIYKTNTIKVNSRHKSIIKKTDLQISGVSNDGHIEAIEAPDKRFFVGIQWHPENMIEYSKEQNNLFKYFINCCEK